MPASEIERATIWEDYGASFLARIRNPDGDYPQKLNFTKIGYALYDLDSTAPETPLSTGSVSVNASIFSTMQTDGRWESDPPGYNFCHSLGSTSFPVGNHLYHLRYRLTQSTGGAFPIVYEPYARRRSGT